MFSFGKGKINKLIEDLSKRYDNLKDCNLDTRMAKLKLISDNNEEYKDLYNAIELNYKSLINDYYMDIEEAINNIEINKATTDKKIIKNDIKLVNEKLDKAEAEQEQITNQISTMFEQENKIRDDLVPLKEKYRDFVDTFEEVKDGLDCCSSIFATVIKGFDKSMESIDNHLGCGEYKEAREDLDKFRNDLDTYFVHLKTMPQMVEFVFKTLPSRYDEVMDMYDSMIEEGYVLNGIKIGQHKEEINGLFEIVKEAFLELRYNEVKEEMRNIAYKINEVKVSLQQEQAAKENFDENNDRVYTFIEDINKKALKNKRDFYSINGYYLIDKGKEDELLYIENELANLSRLRIELENYIHSPTKYPYSILNNKLESLTSFSENLNDKVDDFQNYIYSLKDDSNYAYKYVNDASVAVTYYYDMILSLKHEFLINKYKDRYQEVVGLIDIINKTLMSKPIFVDKVNEMLTDFKGKANTLLKDMKDSIKVYDSASKIILYTNKYRSSFTIVNDALNRAMVHFENGEFDFAIDRLTEILQQVHPQAYEEMVKFRSQKDE